MKRIILGLSVLFLLSAQIGCNKAATPDGVTELTTQSVVSTPTPVSPKPSAEPVPSVPGDTAAELTIIQRAVLAMMVDFGVSVLPENDVAGTGNATHDMTIFPSSRYYLYGLVLGNITVYYFPLRSTKGTYSVDTKGTVTQVTAGTSTGKTATSPNTSNATPSPAPAPWPPPITDPALAKPRTNWRESSPPPAGVGGWTQPRPLADEEKRKVIEIALNSSQAKNWLQGRTNYGMGSVCWFAIIWESNSVAKYAYPEYEVVNNGIPSWVNPHSWWYPAITLRLGELGSMTQMQIAIDLDNQKVAFVDGPYPPPGQITITPPR